MPLLDPASELPDDRLRELRASLLAELREKPELLADEPGASSEELARGGTARQLIAETLAWVGSRSAPRDRSARIAEINLLYAVTVVADEYYKLFVRRPTPERPAGRI